MALTSKSVKGCRLHASDRFTMRAAKGHAGVTAGAIDWSLAIDTTAAKKRDKKKRNLSKKSRRRMAQKAAKRSLAHHCATR